MVTQKIRLRRCTVKPGLTPKEAYKAISKKAKSDFRGWTYNKKTGKVTYI